MRTSHDNDLQRKFSTCKVHRRRKLTFWPCLTFDVLSQANSSFRSDVNIQRCTRKKKYRTQLTHGASNGTIEQLPSFVGQIRFGIVQPVPAIIHSTNEKRLIYLPWTHWTPPVRTVTFRMAHPAYQFDLPLISRTLPKKFGNFILAGVTGQLRGTQKNKDFGWHRFCDSQWKWAVWTRGSGGRRRKTGGLVNDLQIFYRSWSLVKSQSAQCPKLFCAKVNSISR